MSPVVPVKYWRQPSGAFNLLVHSTMVILIVKAEVVAVLELPKVLVRELHWSQVGMYMCSPVFVPHITGEPFPQGLVTANVSV